MDTPGTAVVDLMQFYDISPCIHARARSGGFVVTLESQIPGAELHYTLDGSEPDLGAPAYSGPFMLDSTATVCCAAWQDGRQRAETRVTLHDHAALGRLPVLDHAYSERYPAGGKRAL